MTPMQYTAGFILYGGAEGEKRVRDAICLLGLPDGPKDADYLQRLSQFGVDPLWAFSQIGPLGRIESERYARAVEYADVSIEELRKGAAKFGLSLGGTPETDSAVKRIRLECIDDYLGVQ